MSVLPANKPIQRVQIFLNDEPLGPPRQILWNLRPGAPHGPNSPHGWCVTEPCPEEVTIKFLAQLLRVKPFKVIADLLKLGVLAHTEQTVPFETALEVLRYHGYVVEEAGNGSNLYFDRYIPCVSSHYGNRARWAAPTGGWTH